MFQTQDLIHTIQMDLNEFQSELCGFTDKTVTANNKNEMDNWRNKLKGDTEDKSNRMMGGIVIVSYLTISFTLPLSHSPSQSLSLSLSLSLTLPLSLSLSLFLSLTLPLSLSLSFTLFLIVFL